MSFNSNYSIISDINDKFRYYKSTESLYELDQWSGLPQQGAEYRQKMSAFIADQKKELFSTADAAAAYRYFSGTELGNVEDFIIRGMIRTFLNRYESYSKSPVKLINSYNLLRADTMNAWKEAREAKDFRVFEPWLKQVFELKKQIALAIDPEKPAFDTLVSMTDEGLLVKDVAREFEILKPGIIGLMSQISEKGRKVDRSILEREELPDRMTEFGRRLIGDIGFDPTKGSINHKVVHGFCSFMGPKDARISTQRSGKVHMLFTLLHENGHQMYSSGSNDAVIAANMWGGLEGSFHEANARFYENIIGKSRAYWEHYYPMLQEEFPYFREISLNDFYSAINDVHPSLRRIEADEVSYSLHAILRFELEKEYFDGTLSIHDMADAWNQKYEKYLGIRPSNDLEGVLQDMHWAGDYIGYFQSYALGNIYDGQILETMLRDVPDFSNDIAKGKFGRINAWMQENIWQYGCCYTSAELMKKLTGKSLNASSFVKYLNEKYTSLYHLSNEMGGTK